MTKYSDYPKPQAEYEEILQNPDVFLQKLRDFHVYYGTEFSVPSVGGNHLDLHRIFMEVTSRGGIEKVISDRRWKEIVGACTLPSSITSASFVLRKYYLSLLYHFEQVYYFRKERPSTLMSGKNDDDPTSSHTLDSTSSNQFSVSPNLVDGSLVNGTIDGKFDDGYLITVTLGFEQWKGVLYHIPGTANASHSISISSVSTSAGERKITLTTKCSE